MQEALEVASEYARAIWRRRWLGLSVAWAVCLLLWLAVLLLPDRYQARASVYVDAATALRPVLEGLAVGDDPESQVSLVREALVARPQLESVAHKTGLDSGVKSRVDLDNLILDLQSDLKITSSASQGGGAENLYTITYQHSDRDKAVQVVRSLLESFVQGTLSGNRTGSDEAQTFLRAQIAEYEKRLADAEAKLAEFKKRYVGLIPGERGDYFARLDSEMNSLRHAETSLALAVSRRDALREQLVNSKPYVPGTSGSLPQSGGLASTPDISLRRQEAEAKLEELLLRFTDKHPEVIALKTTIAELKQREQKELSDLSRGAAGTGAIRSLSVNPVYQGVQMQLNQVEVEQASLRGAIAQHEKSIAELKRYVDLAPEVEQEYAKLNRDYGINKAQYEALVKRLEQARVSDSAGREGIIKFDVIEPPNANVRPAWPNRRLLTVVGLLLGVFVGAAVAAVKHVLSPRFHDVWRLGHISGLRVLGSVSHIETSSDENRRKREFLGFIAAGTLLLVVGVVLIILGNTGSHLLRGLFV